MENVKEFLTGNQRHHFELLRHRLEKAGYEVWADVHDLSSFGLPQRRRRALLIAMRDKAAEPLRPSMSVVRTVRDAIGHLPHVKAGECHPSDRMHVSPRITPKVLDRIRAIPRDGGSWRDIMLSTSLSDETKRHLLTPAMFRARAGSFPDVYGRLWWDRPAVTITRECAHFGNGRYAHPEQDRLLTVREMALLQGFPPGYVFEGPLTARYNQIGDAVPPLVSEIIAEHVATLLCPWQIKTRRNDEAAAS
jgi:DNA (cytosine-5)-methyltransferase 1